jgi:NADH:ubiquinone oxidoreductase subunit F (NADH-binding)
MKMLGPNGVISIKGDIKRTYDCDRESCEMTDMLLASGEFQELKQTLVESHPDKIMPEVKTSKLSIQPEDTLNKTVPLY